MGTPDKFIGRSELDVLLAHLVRSMQVLLPALRRLKATDFDDMTETGHRLIWACAEAFYREHNRVVPLEILYAEIEKRAKDYPQLGDPNLLQAVYNLAYDLFKIEEKDLVPSYALSLLDTFLYRRRIANRWLVNAEKNNVSREEFERIKIEEDKIRISRGKVYSPFADDADSWLGVTPRDPTGVIFIDMLLNGGIRPKETYGFIAPSGGGKTTLAGQMAITYAKRGRKVLVLTYEQGISKEYMVPIISCSAHISRDRVEKLSREADLTEEERARYAVVKRDINDSLRFVDMSGTTETKAGSGGPAEIEAQLNTLAFDSFKPDLIIIDWFLPMARRYLSNMKVDRETLQRKSEDRNHYQDLTDAIKQIATKYNCAIWVNHQLAPASAGKKGAVGQTDAAEFKSFSWLFDACFALTQLDAAGYGMLNMSKARNQKAQKSHIRLMGEFATFVSTSGEMSWDPRTKAYVKEKEKNVIPKDEKIVSESDLSKNAVDFEVK